MKKLLETIDTMSKAEKKPEGAEFKGYWKGTDKSPPKPGQSVGGCEESKNPNIMRDLKSVADDKELEWKLSEEFANFNEDDLGVEEKRPHRSGSREEKFGTRGHKEKPRYKTIADITESALIDKEDYRAKRKALQDIQFDPETEKDPELKAELMRRKASLEKEAKAMGLKENTDWGNIGQKEFKRKEMEHELGDEDKTARYYNPNPRTPKMIGMYFYNVPAGQESSASNVGLKQTKSGKWAITKYDTSGATFSGHKQRADIRFGNGQWWAPKQVSEGESAEKYRSTISSFDRMSKMAKLNTELQKLAKLVKEKEGRIRPKTEINEFGATPVTAPIGTATAKPAIGTPAVAAVDPIQAKNVAAATATLKSATSNPAAPTAIAKAINNASTGATVNAQDMKALAPMMGLVGQAAQDPKLANQFKSFAVQAQQAMKK